MPSKPNNSSTPDDVLGVLDALYEKALKGIPRVSPSVDSLVSDYLAKDPNPRIACKAMHFNAIAKCAASGLVTGFGGILTLPVSLPANMTSVLYMQMRMVAATAQMSGLDLETPQAKTLVYACLAGVDISGALRAFGVQVGEKLVTSTLERLPFAVLRSINRKLTIRFAAKLSQKGFASLGKMVPIVGAVVNGGFDLAETKDLASRSFRWFFEGDFRAEADDDDTDDGDKPEPKPVEYVVIEDVEPEGKDVQ